ncbi:MAG: hypothetical protein AB7F31_02230 [Parachlamydiales bacterium]
MKSNVATLSWTPRGVVEQLYHSTLRHVSNVTEWVGSQLMDQVISPTWQGLSAITPSGRQTLGAFALLTAPVVSYLIGAKIVSLLLPPKPILYNHLPCNRGLDSQKLGIVTHGEYAILANAAYNPGEEQLPRDWKPYVNAEEMGEAFENYWGIAFINDTSQNIVIANRGTVLSSSDLATDATLGLLKRMGPHFLHAQRFTIAVLRKQSHDSEIVQGYQVSFTGHSLGSALAQVCAYQYKMPCVSFEPPGARELIERMLLADLITQQTIDLEWCKRNFVSYVNAPNIVNTSGRQLGRVFLTERRKEQPKVSWWRSWLPTPSFLMLTQLRSFLILTQLHRIGDRMGVNHAIWQTVEGHPLQSIRDDLVSQINNNKPASLKRVERWPSGAATGILAFAAYVNYYRDSSGTSVAIQYNDNAADTLAEYKCTPYKEGTLSLTLFGSDPNKGERERITQALSNNSAPLDKTLTGQFTIGQGAITWTKGVGILSPDEIAQYLIRQTGDKPYKARKE